MFGKQRFYIDFLGACKALPLTHDFNFIGVSDFHSPQPEGYLLKTSVEINLRDNMYNFEKQLNVEARKRISYVDKFDHIIMKVLIETSIGHHSLNICKFQRTDPLCLIISFLN